MHIATGSLAPRGQSLTTALFLLLVMFGLFNANFRHSSGTDTLGSSLLAVSVLREGNFDLEEFRDLLDNEAQTLRAGLALGSLQERDGVLVGSYPVGAGLMALPFYFIADRAGLLREWHDYRTTAKIASSFLCAMSVAMLFLCLVQLTPYGPALIIAALYGLGTCMWPVLSQDIWQHGPGMLCLVTALYCLLLLRHRGSWLLAGCAGLAIAMAVICRLLNAIPAVIFALYVFVEYRRSPALLAAFAVPAGLCGAWLLWFNLSSFGELTGGYSAIYQSQWHGWRKLDQTGLYTTPLGYGLAGILISPSKGLLVYSPYTLFCFAALGWVLLRRRNAFNLSLIAWTLLAVVPIAKNAIWWGGAAYGARYMSEILIPLSMLLAIAWPVLCARRWVQTVFALLAIASVGIQYIGVFRFPCGWIGNPVNIDLAPERHWDWRDSQIERCLKEGLLDSEVANEILVHKPGDVDF